jgi:hypothetical protein
LGPFSRAQHFDELPALWLDQWLVVLWRSSFSHPVSLTEWWHIVVGSDPYFLTLLWIDFALCAFVFLLTWRIEHRLGLWGMARVFGVAAMIGPARTIGIWKCFRSGGIMRQSLRPRLGSPPRMYSF